MRVKYVIVKEYTNKEPDYFVTITNDDITYKDLIEKVKENGFRNVGTFFVVKIFTDGSSYISEFNYGIGVEGEESPNLLIPFKIMKIIYKEIVRWVEYGK